MLPWPSILFLIFVDFSIICIVDDTMTNEKLDFTYPIFHRILGFENIDKCYLTFKGSSQDGKINRLRTFQGGFDEKVLLSNFRWDGVGWAG